MAEIERKKGDWGCADGEVDGGCEECLLKRGVCPVTNESLDCLFEGIGEILLDVVVGVLLVVELCLVAVDVETEEV